eukprot:c34015_g1_i1.p1 GENE.c34015_g1_i1~~c34015_g1_i1.p1  ORF type:complete len:304 (-),score=36.48 c34015_g1_i1:46-843(-)
MRRSVASSMTVPIVTLALMACALATVVTASCPSQVTSLSTWNSPNGYTFSSALSGANPTKFLAYLCTQASKNAPKCSTKSPSPASNVALCMETSSSSTTEIGGWPSKVSTTSAGLVFTSSKGEKCSSGDNYATVTIRCDNSLAANGITMDPTYTYATSTCTWSFTGSSKDVCALFPSPPPPGGGGGGHSKKKGLSVGSILLILLLVCSVVYLVAGMAFQFQFRQARGLDLIPNRAFWTMLPGLIKDGFLFVYRKIRGQNTHTPIP